MKPTDYAMTIVWSEDDQAYLARVPSLPGCVADGKTREEAVANAVSVIQDWIDTAKELGRPVPAPLSDQEYHQRAKEITGKSQELFQKALNDALQKALRETEAELWTKFQEQLQELQEQQEALQEEWSVLWTASAAKPRIISNSPSALTGTSARRR